MKHENPFKPSNPNKHGVLGTIAKYPEYKGDPLKPLIRNDKEKIKEPFKFLNYKYLEIYYYKKKKLKKKNIDQTMEGI
jgi:hypothetical protein